MCLCEEITLVILLEINSKIWLSVTNVCNAVKGIRTWLEALFFTFQRAGWVECWTVPSVMLTIDYTWHPIYPQKADEQLKQSCKCFYIIHTLKHLVLQLISTKDKKKKKKHLEMRLFFWCNCIHLKSFKDFGIILLTFIEHLLYIKY